MCGTVPNIWGPFEMIGGLHRKSTAHRTFTHMFSLKAALSEVLKFAPRLPLHDNATRSVSAAANGYLYLQHFQCIDDRIFEIRYELVARVLVMKWKCAV